MVEYHILQKSEEIVLWPYAALKLKPREKPKYFPNVGHVYVK